MHKFIKICDTTLRDGEQMPGVVFSSEEKLTLAEKSSLFGSDFLEIMPAVSEGEKRLTKQLVNLDLDAEITASTMLRQTHVELALECGVQNVTLFTPLSDLHLKYRLGITREENLDRTLDLVEYCRAQGLKVNFAGEDATRADTDYVIDFIRQLSGKIEYFLPCDTLGCLTPYKTYLFVKKLKGATDRQPLLLHIHNDFGLATANTLAGLAAGAEGFSGTFGGLGERAGNAPIEEVCTALKYLYEADLGVKHGMLGEICSLVEEYSGVKLQPHKPIVGPNAFSHESGIHVDGMLKHPRTYENFDPPEVGRERQFLFGKHSGKALLRRVLGYDAADSEVAYVLERVKSLVESRKGPLSEAEVLALRNSG